MFMDITKQVLRTKKQQQSDEQSRQETVQLGKTQGGNSSRSKKKPDCC